MVKYKSRKIKKEWVKEAIFKGVIIEESLKNKDVLSKVDILSKRVEKVTKKHKTPWLKKWTLYTVSIPEEKAAAMAKRISKSLDYSNGSAWYADFKNNKLAYIIFFGKIFVIRNKNKAQYMKAKEYGISLGIPEYQVDFST